MPGIVRRRMDNCASKIEILERRQFLAGNVTVAINASLTATIIGDNKSNEIAVTLMSNGSGYLLTGLDGTKINGYAAVTIPTSTAYNFNISMGNGDDLVEFVGPQLGTQKLGTQNLNLSMGNGDDRVILQGTTVFGDVSIATGNGKDAVSLATTHVTQDLAISTGNGNDRVVLASDLQVDGTVSVDGGHGKNAITGVPTSTATAAAATKKGKKKPHHRHGHD